MTAKDMAFRNWAARLAVTAMSVAPAMALAADPHAAPPAEGGMPQLRFGDPLLLSKTVWLVIIFAIFFYICWRYLLPPVGEVLESRQARIEGDLAARGRA